MLHLLLVFTLLTWPWAIEAITIDSSQAVNIEIKLDGAVATGVLNFVDSKYSDDNSSGGATAPNTLYPNVTATWSSTETNLVTVIIDSQGTEQVKPTPSSSRTNPVTVVINSQGTERVEPTPSPSRTPPNLNTTFTWSSTETNPITVVINSQGTEEVEPTSSPSRTPPNPNTTFTWSSTETNPITVVINSQGTERVEPTPSPSRTPPNLNTTFTWSSTETNPVTVVINSQGTEQVEPTPSPSRTIFSIASIPAINITNSSNTSFLSSGATFTSGGSRGGSSMVQLMAYLLGLD
ncbi:hypothetical protein QBC46DRAFT_413375 [Diplogelasinospora grovesii]|uniref:Uncharacterized protein n=1 Tax=Diplogelasinospora grovesii TaxID=303347 RepID=A0AAN6MZF1_9PEZI|nr:hypothetical protein QBC46DRAFT_413375 [Diplogelasinospora grovesii]